MSARSSRWLWALLLAGLAACGSGKGDEDEGDGEGTTGSGGNIDLNDGVQFDGDGPVIVEGRVWCQAGSDSSGMIFIFEVDYADPQGDYDVAGGSVTGSRVSDGGEVFTDNILVCRDGRCDGSFRDGIYAPITCVTADDYFFTAVLTDRSGIDSEPLELEWDG